ncbi:hypothetical protein [Erwinia piriflorinigrans]|nr:hypothetical protein [Erwinia piriflorinigrans]
MQPVLQPAPAVMLQWSNNTVVPLSPVPLPVGIAQQGSAATEEKQQTKDKQQQPSPEAAGILLSG